MQPTSPPPAVLASQAATTGGNAAAATTASVERVEQRPASSLAQGSFAWPAWAVILVALAAGAGGLWWWLRLRTTPHGTRPGTAAATSTQGARR